MVCTRDVPWICLAVFCAGFACLVRADSPTVYRCELHGQRVFSDRPCDGSAQTIVLSSAPMNVYQHQEYDRHPLESRTDKHSRTRADERRTPAHDEDKQRAACRRIAQSIDWVHSKQRAGYRAKEGVRLDERLRRLEEERRQRCA